MEREELEKKLALALNSQQWIHQELCEMRTFIEDALGILEESHKGDPDAKIQEAKNELMKIQRQVDARCSNSKLMP